jgi:hypothetical protein
MPESVAEEAARRDGADFLRRWADDINASSGYSVDADKLRRIAALLHRTASPVRRGLTVVERELFEALHDRLAVARDRIGFVLRECTVDHALPVLQDVRSIYQGAAFLKALLLEPTGPANG